jgi:hypothetical protein
MELGSISSCVPAVAIRRFYLAKHSPPQAGTCLPSLVTRGAHRYLATLANRHNEGAI